MSDSLYTTAWLGIARYCSVAGEVQDHRDLPLLLLLMGTSGKSAPGPVPVPAAARGLAGSGAVNRMTDWGFPNDATTLLTGFPRRELKVCSIGSKLHPLKDANTARPKILFTPDFLAVFYNNTGSSSSRPEPVHSFCRSDYLYNHGVIGRPHLLATKDRFHRITWRDRSHVPLAPCPLSLVPRTVREKLLFFCLDLLTPYRQAGPGTPAPAAATCPP